MKRPGNADLNIKDEFKKVLINEQTKEMKNQHPDKNKEINDFLNELINKITNVKKIIDVTHKKCVLYRAKRLSLVLHNMLHVGRK